MYNAKSLMFSSLTLMTLEKTTLINRDLLVQAVPTTEINEAWDLWHPPLCPAEAAVGALIFCRLAE